MENVQWNMCKMIVCSKLCEDCDMLREQIKWLCLCESEQVINVILKQQRLPLYSLRICSWVCVGSVVIYLSICFCFFYFNKAGGFDKVIHPGFWQFHDIDILINDITVCFTESIINISTSIMLNRLSLTITNSWLDIKIFLTIVLFDLFFIVK